MTFLSKTCFVILCIFSIQSQEIGKSDYLQHPIVIGIVTASQNRNKKERTFERKREGEEVKGREIKDRNSGDKGKSWSRSREPVPEVFLAK